MLDAGRSLSLSFTERFIELQDILNKGDSINNGSFKAEC